MCVPNITFSVSTIPLPLFQVTYDFTYLQGVTSDEQEMPIKRALTALEVYTSTPNNLIDLTCFYM